MTHSLTAMLTLFSDWLTGSWLNLAIATHAWIVPALQTLHILSVAVVLSGVLIINLRIVGSVEGSQPISAVLDRFLRPITLAVAVLLVTGLLQIAGEPNRAVFRTVFWVKMTMLLLAFGLTWSHRWIRDAQRRSSVEVGAGRRVLAVLTLLLWLGVVTTGRWIAYANPWPGAPA